MVSTTSNTTSFSLDVDDIIEDALEALGGDPSDAIVMQKARRTLNLLLVQLQNKNIPLNKIEEATIPLLPTVSSYVLDESIVDILELNIKEDGGDLEIPIERYGLREFHQIPNKTTSQRPTAWATDRQENAVTVKFWPVPNIAYTANILVSKRVEDVTASYQKIDLSYRYLPLLTKWLSYELGLRKQGVPADLLIALKLERDEAMMDAFDEDRERVDFIVRPGGISGR